MTMQLDDSWENHGGPIYYRNSEQRWICVDCDYDTTSPFGASCHAAIHGITLPNARKKEPVKKPQSQAQIEPKNEEKSQFTYTRKGSIFDVIGKNQNPQPRKLYSKHEYEMWIENQKSEEHTKKLILLMKYKQTGIFTDAELEEKKIELGLAEREDPKIKIQKQQTRDRWLTLIAMERDPQVLQTLWMNFYFLEQAGVL